MADHDHGYKLLFSHAALVADLIRGFVREEWVRELDFSTLERVSGGYVSDDLRDRESDVVWRLKWRGGEWVYVYLLLEFQSTNEPFMAVRVLVYVGLLYQDLLRQGTLTFSGKLPPILPIVLYNGYGPWTGAPDIADLVEALPGGLERYRPSLRYCLLDEMRLAESELPSVRNLAAALFRLEQSRTPDDVRRVLGALVEWLGEPQHASLRHAFTVWLVRVLLPARAPGVRIPEVEDLQEVGSMLAEDRIDWSLEWKQKGREEGREEGLKAMRPAVLVQLEQRFGPLPDESRRRIEAIHSFEDLAALASRILMAGSLAELGL